MNIAIVGATGLVGKMFLEILEERNFLYNKIYLVASKSSSGKQIKFNNQNHVVLTIDDILDKKIDLAFFSAELKILIDVNPFIQARKLNR